MGKMTISYADIADENKRIRMACLDTAQYLGYRRFRIMVSLIKADREKEVDFGFMVAGVEGYPCWAMWKRYNPEAL